MEFSNKKKNRIIKINCLLCNYVSYSKSDIDICLVCFSESHNVQKSYQYDDTTPVLPKSIIITNSFMHLDVSNHKTNSILHVGISNSKCIIYNFWSSYLKEKPTDNEIFKNVLAIDLESCENKSNDSYKIISNDNEFDKALDENMKIQSKEFPKYDQLNNNCFAYICRFLNSIKYLNNDKWTKETLSDSLISPAFEKFEKFCLIFQELKTSDQVVKKLDEDNKKIVVKICDVCGVYVENGKAYHCGTCADYDLCGDCYIYTGHIHEMTLS